MSATEIVASLAQLEGWKLTGDGAERRDREDLHLRELLRDDRLRQRAGLDRHREDHHPDLSVHYNRCVVRFNTHDVGGISTTDFDCAAQADACSRTEPPMERIVG